MKDTMDMMDMNDTGDRQPRPDTLAGSAQPGNRIATAR